MGTKAMEKIKETLTSIKEGIEKSELYNDENLTIQTNAMGSLIVAGWTGQMKVIDLVLSFIEQETTNTTLTS